MAARRIVVLGGSGFVGSALVARLAAQGETVVVPVRRRAPARHLILLPTVEVVEADVHDPATLAALVRGADAVVNLVGILNESGRTTFARVHADLARSVVDACRAGGVRRLLHMSALNADPAGPSRYLRSKGEAEAAVVASGLAWTVFRPSVIFGAGDSFLTLFARLARALPVIALAAPDARFQPVHVGDVVTAFARSLDIPATEGRRFDLCGPTVYTLRELVRFAAETSGAVRPIVPLRGALATLQAFALEHLPGKLMSRDNLASMSKDSVCDCPFPPEFGIEPASLESVAPSWLAPQARRGPYDAMRASAGR
ncbi:MAG: complex I NDUFA9 subunit family protein [Betaproteobacteria bacterium]|nr:complex I NDUFA9 subunit family protein [Betaproteobacteria bacterium]